MKNLRRGLPHGIALESAQVGRRDGSRPGSVDHRQLAQVAFSSHRPVEHSSARSGLHGQSQRSGIRYLLSDTQLRVGCSGREHPLNRREFGVEVRELGHLSSRRLPSLAQTDAEMGATPVTGSGAGRSSQQPRRLLAANHVAVVLVLLSHRAGRVCARSREPWPEVPSSTPTAGRPRQGSHPKAVLAGTGTFERCALWCGKEPLGIAFPGHCRYTRRSGRPPTTRTYLPASCR